MSVSLPNKLPKLDEKRDKFNPADTSAIRKDLEKHVSKLQSDRKSWWKRIVSSKNRGAAVGVGCGVGVGFGLTGAAGMDPFLSVHLPLQAGVGWGVGFGWGAALRPYGSKPKSKVRRI